MSNDQCMRCGGPSTTGHLCHGYLGPAGTGAAQVAIPVPPDPLLAAWIMSFAERVAALDRRMREVELAVRRSK